MKEIEGQKIILRNSTTNLESVASKLFGGIILRSLKEGEAVSSAVCIVLTASLFEGAGLVAHTS